MSIGHCICAAVLALAGSVSIAAAQQPAAAPLLAAGNPSSFAVFLGSVRVGAEQVVVTRTAEGWTILSTGRIGAPVDITARRMEVRYTADWKPVDLSLDATVRGQLQTIHTKFAGTTAQ